MQMKVLIIEDEAPAFRRLQTLLDELASDLQIVEVIDSVEDAVKWLHRHELPDLIFMDIQLSDGISFEIFEKVTISSPVIFTTAFDEYTLRAFKVNSIDYLLKPIKKDELREALVKFRSLSNAKVTALPNLAELLQMIRPQERQYKSRFLVKQADKLIAVETDQVAVFYLHLGVVHLITWDSKVYLLDYSLDDLQQQLDPSIYYRANRQNILHLRSISVVHKYHKGKLLVETLPKLSEQVIVSAEKASEFKNWLGDA